jgi:hypothetical protein
VIPSLSSSALCSCTRRRLSSSYSAISHVTPRHTPRHPRRRKEKERKRGAARWPSPDGISDKGKAGGRGGRRCGEVAGRAVDDIDVADRQRSRRRRRGTAQ